ncbi:MAG: rhodanese-like domain-containing protein [Bacilli bacterium]|nr:rhodanese-like domain-containing protein [Bacilli bacterium]MDD4809194.1 rhodanese-like domain-containing protein [Bacilli bacterium]
MNISIHDLLKLEDISIIDIRSIENYNNNHILNAKNIPYQVLINNFNKYLSKGKKYYIYCQRGIKSKKACALLNSLGYNTINIIGGYESWMLEQ